MTVSFLWPQQKFDDCWSIGLALIVVIEQLFCNFPVASFRNLVTAALLMHLKCKLCQSFVFGCLPQMGDVCLSTAKV